MKLENFKILYERICHGNKDMLCMVEYSDDNGTKWTKSGRITSYDTDCVEMLSVDGSQCFILMSYISSISPYNEATGNHAAKAVYNDHSKEIKEFLSKDRGAQKTANQIDNIIMSAKKNNALGEKSERIKREIVLFLEDYEGKAAKLFAADRYQSIGEFKEAAKLFLTCDKENAKYCADKSGIEGLLESLLTKPQENTAAKARTEKHANAPKAAPDTVYTGKIVSWDNKKIFGYIASDKDIEGKKSFFFHLSSVKDTELRNHLYNNHALPDERIPVSFLLGNNGNNEPACTRIEASSKNYLTATAEKSHIVKKGFIEHFNPREEHGKIFDGRSRYNFKMHSIIDPYLKNYLQNSFHFTEIDVHFTFDGTSNNMAFVSNITATEKSQKVIKGAFGSFSDPEFDRKLEEAGSHEALIEQICFPKPTTATPTYRELPLWGNRNLKVDNFVLADADAPYPFENRTLHYANELHPCDKGARLMINEPEKAEQYLLDALQRGDNIEKALRCLLGNVMLRIKKDPYAESVSILNYFKPHLQLADFLKFKIQLLSKSVRTVQNADVAEQHYNELINALYEILPISFTASTKMHYYSLLATALTKTKRFTDAISAMQEIKKLAAEDKQNRLILNTDRLIANSYYQSGDVQKAKEMAQELLKQNPNDGMALAIIKDESVTPNDDILFDSVDDFGKLSGYPKYTVDSVLLETLAVGKWKEFIKDGELVAPAEKVIPEIQAYIENRIKRMAPSSKGEGWAFLAKVVQQLCENGYEGDKRISVQTVNEYAGRSMLYYGDYVALSFVNKWDTLRFYYSQTLNMVSEKNRDATNAFNRMICSLYIQGAPLVDVVQNAISSENKHLTFAQNGKCGSLRTLFLQALLLDNRSNSRIREFLEHLLKNTVEDEQEILTFSGLADEFDIEADRPIDKYYNAWTRLRVAYRVWLETLESELLKFRSSITSVKALYNHIAFLQGVLDRNLLVPTDQLYVRKYIDILSELQLALESNEFDRCEDLFQRTIDDSAKLFKQFHDEPTALSFEHLREAVETVKNYTSELLNELYEKHKPQLTITCNDGFLNQGKLPLHFMIKNADNTQTAEILSIDVKPDTSGVEIENNMTKLIRHIGGGGSEEVSRTAVLGADFDEKYVEVYFTVKFSFKGSQGLTEERSITEPIHIELRDSSLFVEIKNPFAPFAEGGEVVGDMFRGRASDINEIVSMLDTGNSMLAHRGIIMYGQKRAGKSSILANLRESIENTYGKDTYLFFKVGSIGTLVSPTVADFLSFLLNKMSTEIRRNHRDIYKRLCEDEIPLSCHIDASNREFAALELNNTITNICEALETYGGDNRYIPLFLIDEFTYIYQWIKEGVPEMSNFPHFWKAFLQNNRVCSIVIGQDNTPIFLNMPEFSNDFACMKTWPVSYLKEDGARELIEKPILNENGESRFDEAALQMLLRLTAGSAFLIVSLCSRLVSYMNKRCHETVTKLILNQFIKDLFVREHIDWNLIFEAQINDPSKIGEEVKTTEADNTALLSYISCNCDDDGWLSENGIPFNILSTPEKTYRDTLIQELVRRDVLIKSERKGISAYKIKIGLLWRYFEHINGIEREEY